MPLYTAKEHQWQISSVKLNGLEVMKDLYIFAADTDEGWLDIYKTYCAPNGGRKIMMSDWEPDPDKPGASTRRLLTERITGKVEVTLGD